jgi:hypothetical protein
LEGDVSLCFWGAGAVNEPRVSNDCFLGVAHVCKRSSSWEMGKPRCLQVCSVTRTFLPFSSEQN